MTSTNFNEDLLEQKRKKFYEAVSDSCKARDVPMPVINFDGCVDETEDQQAHHHTYTNTICVSKYQLMRMSFDDVYETATHEAAHVTEHNHGPGFHGEHERGKIGGFRPHGTVIDGGRPIVNQPKLPQEEDRIKCNYNLCRKETKLVICEYCQGFFCQEHLRAKPPGTPHFRLKGAEGQLLAKEWREPGGHPCSPYFDYWREENKKKADEYMKTLNALLKNKESPRTRPPEIPTSQTHTPRRSRRHSKPVPTVKTNTTPLLIILFILLASGTYFALKVNRPAESVNSTPIPEKVTFANYFDKIGLYDGKRVQLTGYLGNQLEETANIERYTYKIVDDFSRKINLIWLDDAQRAMFIKKQVTKEKYDVTGTLRRDYGSTLTMEVAQITQSLN